MEKKQPPATGGTGDARPRIGRYVDGRYAERVSRNVTGRVGGVRRVGNVSRVQRVLCARYPRRYVRRRGGCTSVGRPTQFDQLASCARVCVRSFAFVCVRARVFVSLAPRLLHVRPTLVTTHRGRAAGTCSNALRTRPQVFPGHSLPPRRPPVRVAAV